MKLYLCCMTFYLTLFLDSSMVWVKIQSPASAGTETGLKSAIAPNAGSDLTISSTGRGSSGHSAQLDRQTHHDIPASLFSSPLMAPARRSVVKDSGKGTVRTGRWVCASVRNSAESARSMGLQTIRRSRNAWNRWRDHLQEIQSRFQRAWRRPDPRQARWGGWRESAAGLDS